MFFGLFRRLAWRRAIYRYFDGRRWRRIDPLPVWRAIFTDAECRFEDDWPSSFEEDTPPEERLQVLQRLAALSRRVFNVKPYHEGGLTEWELHSLLADFIGWMMELKKNTNPSPTPLPTTTSESSDPGDSTTKPPSDSSSTAPEPDAAEPTEPLKSACPYSAAESEKSGLTL